MNKLASIMVWTMIAASLIFFVEFLVINLILNCQTWDATYWTETSSCMTPLQMIGWK